MSQTQFAISVGHRDGPSWSPLWCETPFVSFLLVHYHYEACQTDVTQGWVGFLERPLDSQVKIRSVAPTTWIGYHVTADDIKLSPFFVGEDDCKRQFYLTFASRGAWNICRGFQHGWTPRMGRWNKDVYRKRRLERPDHTSYVCSYCKMYLFWPRPQQDFRSLPTKLAPPQRPCAFLSVSVGGSIYLFPFEGRPCDCMPCLVGNTMETSTSSL